MIFSESYFHWCHIFLCGVKETKLRGSEDIFVHGDMGYEISWVIRFFSWKFLLCFHHCQNPVSGPAHPNPASQLKGKQWSAGGAGLMACSTCLIKNWNIWLSEKNWEIRELWTIISSKGLFLTDPASFGMLTTDEPRVPQRRSQFYIPVVSPDSNQPPEPPPREYKWWNISAWRGHYELSQWQEARQQEGAPFPNTFVPISPIGQSAVMV